MKEQDKSPNELSFPPPFEMLNEELAPHAESLRNAYQELELYKNKWQKALDALDGVTIFHPSYKNLETVERSLQKNITKIESKVRQLEAQTYGYMDRVLKEIETEPELAKQVMTVLDKNIHPEKYENLSPEEEKLATDKDTPALEAAYQGKNPQEAKDIRDTNRETIPVDTDYYSYLLEREKSKRQKDVAKGDKEKPTPSTPSLGYLNYQLNFQRPTYPTPEEKNKSKEKDDKTIEPE